MKTKLLIALICIALVLSAAGLNQYRVISWYPADEYPVYVLSNGHQLMLGVPAGGSRLVPPVGARCRLVGDLFKCGRWQSLRAYPYTGAQ